MWSPHQTGTALRWLPLLCVLAASAASSTTPSSPLQTFFTEATEDAVAPYFISIKDQVHGVKRFLLNAVDGANVEFGVLKSQLNQLISRQNAIGDRTSREESIDKAIVSAMMSVLRLQLSAQGRRDCSDLPAGSSSGVYLVSPGLGRPVPVFCDQETDGGGWTVFQRRADIQPREDFYRGWHDYKWGFGRLDGEYWWGLENLWLMTTPLDRQYELRIDLEDFEGGKRYAQYQGFRITAEEDGYRMTALNYTGDAGDGLTGRHGSPFSTKDKDQDTWGESCARIYKGAWWYMQCHLSNLNGQYLVGEHTTNADGVNWKEWKGYYYSLKSTDMKIRPTTKL